jgi:G:T-mismatch repair DNA endonuclease (very short patch repair protein)
MSIIWLKFCEKYYNISIQHAENANEYSIPNSRYKADGYCKETNTIFEFHGSRWHGDPLLYNQKSKIFFGIDYGTLYENTKKKENFIKDNGYELIVMWESKWKKINKYIKVLQKKYRELKCKKI